MLRMGRIASQSLLDLLVNDHIDLNPSLSGAFDDLVETPFLVEEGRAAQEEFRRQPPVRDVNRLFGTFQADRDSPHVVTTINIPFYLVVLTLGKEGVEAVAVANRRPLTIGFLLVLLVMTMILVDQILELPNLVLQMDSIDFGVVKLGPYWILLTCWGGS